MDSTKIRKKAVVAYKRARSTFKKAESELEHHHAEDVPSYERWYRNRFGPILSRVEALRKQVSELDQNLNRLDDLKFNYFDDKAEAYAHWQREQDESESFKEPDAEENGFSAEEDTGAEQLLEEEMNKLWERLEQLFCSFINEMRQWIRTTLRMGVSSAELVLVLVEEFCKLEDVPREVVLKLVEREKVMKLLVKCGLERKGTSAKKVETTEPSKEMKIKKIARELAFALHPDQCGEHDAEKLDLWHQVQVAVKAKDLDSLEVLYAHMKLLKGDVGPSVLVSQVMELTEMYRNSRKALRRQLRGFRKTPAWKFGKLKEEERGKVQKSASVELELEEANLLELLKDYEQEMESYRQTSLLKEEKPRKSKKKVPIDEGDWLFDSSEYF